MQTVYEACAIFGLQADHVGMEGVVDDPEVRRHLFDAFECATDASVYRDSWILKGS